MLKYIIDDRVIHMQSRMDKYNTINTSDTEVRSRTKRNQGHYEKIKTSEIKRYDVNNNMSVIDDNIKSVDINKISNFLDEKYGDNTAKRRSIDLPEIDETVEQDPIMDTKEYDINAIIEKAKQGKNIDYTKERLKKVREAQYEILSNLDNEIKNLSEVDKAKEKRKKEEENLKQLINTITEIELKNQMKDTTNDLDLLSDLVGDPDDEKVDSFSMDDTKDPIDLETIDITKELEHIKEQVNKTKEDNNEELEESKEEEAKEETKEELEDTKPDVVIGGIEEKQDTINTRILADHEKNLNYEKKISKQEEHIESTLNKLDIDLSNYDDFNDINKKDKASSVLRIIIFIVFVLLVLGAVVILDNLLGLELLPF
jgi:DNA repair exonuclease SbcCD ATPase subunit